MMKTPNEMYQILKPHNLTALYWYHIKKHGIQADGDMVSRYEKDYLATVLHSVRQQTKYTAIVSLFSENNIAFLPLKGMVLREYYEVPELRFSCDIDILIHSKDFTKAKQLLELNGWKTDGVLNFHDMHFFCDNTHLELHYNICENMPHIDRVLADVWKNVHIKQQNEFEMNNDFLLFHQTAHAYYHYISGGCGIKAVIDIGMLRKKLSFNEDRLNSLLERAQLNDFYDKLVSLTECWFDRKQPDNNDIETEKYIVSGGAYGTRQNLEHLHRKNMLELLREKLFLPRNVMYAYYPKLEACHLLLPYYHLRRYILAFIHHIR